jgi:RNA polymerase sigma factor (sigma-70 family)
MSAGALDPATELQLRELVPRVLGALMRKCGDFSSAEDAVQEALLAAVKDWPRRGVPHNPGGWLYQVACRRLADYLDAEHARKQREVRAMAEQTDMRVQSDGAEVGETALDDTLALLFLCCHPALTEPSATALTLRAVGGLMTAEIARAFLVPEATMAQRISRAKQTIQASSLPFEMPDAQERARRMGAVLHTLYLIFNEGYVSSAGPALSRVELSSEAIRLARIVQRLDPTHAEATGLLALLLLTDARRCARSGPVGELIPLHEQDRGLWDQRAIAEGTALVAQAMALGSVGSYQVQAAIAALHDEAASVAATDWAQILALYSLLARMSDNPIVALNRAVAAAMVHGAATGLEWLRSLDADARLAQSHRLDAVRGHLYELLGERDAAIRHYCAAAGRTANLAEQKYLTTKAAQLLHA